MIASVQLNENQCKAASWNDGPLLVLAGPGSGKTEGLTMRMARVIEASEHTSALALTFTTKAAAEMRQRLDRLLGRHADRAHLCTFHSFAGDVLRQHGSHLGLRPDFSLLTLDEDRIAVLEDVIENLGDAREAIPTDRKNLLNFVDQLFAESYACGAESSGTAHRPEWVPRLHQLYCDALVAGNRLDFGSMLYFARRLLAEKPGVARVVRLGWTHVCVDEFQDTNRAQYDLLRLIAPGRRHNLFVVADDDQIIYQWNGASPERLQDLRRDYDLTTVQLPECYRCPTPIVTLANRLIVHNTRRTPGKLPITSRHDASTPHAIVRYEVLASPEDEAAFLAKDITNRGLSAAECVVLGRTARIVNGVATALRQAGFDAYLARRKSEFESPAARVLLEALRLANARHDRDILRRLCFAWEALAGAPIDPDAVAAAAALVGGDFLRMWADAAAERLSGRAADALARIKTDLVDALAFPAIVEWFVDQGWQSWNGEEDFGLTEEEAGTWKMLHGEIEPEYGRTLPLNAYLLQLDLASKNPRPGNDALRCMTVHAAKGLGFQHVYLIGMAQDVFPSFHALRSGAQSRQVEEERRSCFVAITRVEETLTVTRSRCYYGRPKAPSQFLGEMGLDADT